MAQLSQALAALQASSKLAVYSEPLSTTVETQVDHSEPPLPEQPSSLSVNSGRLPALIQDPAQLEPASIEHSVISLSVDYSELPDTIIAEAEVDVSEPLEVTSLPIEASEPPIDNSELQVLIASSPLVAASESAVVEVAFATKETPHLTRKQLGERLEKSHETIRKWEESGRLAALGWEPVPGTGTGTGIERNPKNPRLYRPTTTTA